MLNQAGFAAALLDVQKDIPAGLDNYSENEARLRFSVYRNNVIVSLINALSETFSVCQQMVGEEFFRALACEYVAKHPPRTAVLSHYGDNFGDFIAAFPPLAHLPYLPYLADLARLEYAYQQAFHAADGVALNAEQIQEILHNCASELGAARLILLPSLNLLCSKYAVVSLWGAHQGALDISQVNPWQHENALLYRPQWEVQINALSETHAAFIEELQSGKTLSEVLEKLSVSQPEFDFSQGLAMLIQLQLITAIEFGA